MATPSTPAELLVVGRRRFRSLDPGENKAGLDLPSTTRVSAAEQCARTSAPSSPDTAGRGCLSTLPSSAVCEASAMGTSAL